MKVRKAVIPAAGLGTRMLPATKTIPKEMLPIAGKPSIHYLVEEAINSGIEEILIITNRAKDVMEDYFDYLPELEFVLNRSGKPEKAQLIRDIADMADIHYVRQKETLGLGHAISKAKRFANGEPVAILLGDDIMMSETPVTKQLINAYEKYGCSAVGVKEVDAKSVMQYCTLDVEKINDTDMYVHNLIEKPTADKILSNYSILGRYVLTSDIFDILDMLTPGYAGEIQLTDAIAKLCKKDKVVAVDFEGRRFDTGNHIGYLEAILEFSLKQDNVAPWLMDFMSKKVKP